MPKWVQVVVGELEFLEGDQLPHPVRSGGRRIRVHVETARHGGLRFARHRPGPRRGETRPDLAPCRAGGVLCRARQGLLNTGECSGNGLTLGPRLGIRKPRCPEGLWPVSR